MNTHAHSGWEPIARAVVLGQPQGQPRPRAHVVAGRARLYNPPGLAKVWREALTRSLRYSRDRPPTPLAEPLRVEIELVFRPPKTIAAALRREKRKPGDTIWHSTRPDADNCAKLVLDAMTDAGWLRDDTCVAELVARKEYALDGEHNGVAIVVSRSRCDRMKG